MSVNCQQWAPEVRKLKVVHIYTWFSWSPSRDSSSKVHSVLSDHANSSKLYFRVETTLDEEQTADHNEERVPQTRKANLNFLNSHHLSCISLVLLPRNWRNKFRNQNITEATLPRICSYLLLPVRTQVLSGTSPSPGSPWASGEVNPNPVSHLLLGMA